MNQRPQHTNFTPGPWKYGYGFICDSDNTILAHVYRRCGTDATVEANAALIARAPELLEDNARLRERVAELEQQLTVEVLSHGVIEWNGSIWDLRDNQ